MKTITEDLNTKAFSLWTLPHRIIYGYKHLGPSMDCQGVTFTEGEPDKIDGQLVPDADGHYFCRHLERVTCYDDVFQGSTHRVECRRVLGDPRDREWCSEITIREALTFQEMLRLSNVGRDNLGFGNTGNSNTGDWNKGNWNTGGLNKGDSNTGDLNKGDLNKGDLNKGDLNKGDSNTGDLNKGDLNKGSWNTGDSNTGDSNTGDWNKGDSNKGDWNAGDSNKGNSNTGDSNKGKPTK